VRWLVVVLAVVACKGGGEPLPDTTIPGITTRTFENNINRAVRRIHDDEAGVTCWVYGSPNGVGMSCLPDRDVRRSLETVPLDTIKPE
jgi:hypothetical protein